MLNEVLRLKQLHHTWIVNTAISSAAYKVLVNKYFIKTSVKWGHSRFIKSKSIWSWKMHSICFLFGICSHGSFLKEFMLQLNLKYILLSEMTHTHSVLYNSRSQSAICRQAASATAGKWLVMSIFELLPTLTKSDTWGGAQKSVFG